MAWSADENGGFTTGTPWLKMGSRYKEINLESDLASDKSVFKYHKALFALRKEKEVLRQGTFTPLHKPEDSFAMYLRELDGERILVVCNFDKATKINVPMETKELLLSNYNRSSKDISEFAPYEIAVYSL